MWRYLLKRIGLMFVTFFITIFIIFVVIKLMPDNHVPSPGADDTWYEVYSEREGWNKPIPVQFWLWIKNIFTTGSFGYSTLYSRDVASVYFGKIPATIQINIIPYFLSIPFAIGLGIIAALKKNKLTDQIISVGIMVFISVPFFVIALMSQFIFYFELGWAPSLYVATASQFDELGLAYGLSTFVLPVIVLTITAIPGFARTVRAELTEQITSEYMLLARSKGLTKNQAVFRHALKNALVPFLPGVFIGIIGIISGGIITEQIFRVDGTGRIYLAAFNDRDYSMIMMVTVFSQFITLLSAIINDISYTFFDPRIRFGSGKTS